MELQFQKDFCFRDSLWLEKNKEKRDLALVYSDVLCDAAAVVTQNKVKGNPVYVTQEHIKNGKAQAIIVNSANANTFNGKEGLINAYKWLNSPVIN